MLEEVVGLDRRRGAQQVFGGGRLGLGGLPLLEPLHHLVDDDLRRDLGRAERDVEVLALAEAHLPDHVGQQRRGDDLLGGQALLAEVILQQLAAGVLGVLAVLGLEPGLDLVARAGRLDQRQPVPRGAALALGGEDLDDVAERSWYESGTILPLTLAPTQRWPTSVWIS